VITLAMAAEIRAPRSAVHAALVDPNAAWRPGVEGLLDPVSGPLRPGSCVRYRCRLRSLPVVLEATTLDLAPDRLRSALSFGSFRCEETLTLASLAGPSPRTRVGLRLAAPSEVPLLGGPLDRFGVRRLAAELAAAALEGLRARCESASLGEDAPGARAGRPASRGGRARPGPDPP
jgi:hypothetical protein